VRSVGQHILTRPLSDSVTRCTNLTEKNDKHLCNSPNSNVGRTVADARPSRLAAYVVVSVEKDYFMRAAEVMLLTSGNRQTG
jgi:hypothetical protein